MREFLFDESGASAIEYALLAGLIAVVIVSTVSATGIELNKLYSRISACVGNPASC